MLVLLSKLRDFLSQRHKKDAIQAEQEVRKQMHKMSVTEHTGRYAEISEGTT